MAFLGVKEAEDSLREFFFKDYGPKRRQLKIFARVIAPKTPEAKEYQKQDELFLRKTKFIDSHKNLILGGNRKLIALIGLKNIAVIDTDDVLLICDIDETQKVKEMFKILEGENPEFVK